MAIESPDRERVIKNAIIKQVQKIKMDKLRREKK